MVVDILRDQRRPDDWAPYISSDVLVAELRRRLLEVGGTEGGLLEARVRDHLVAIIGSRLGVRRQSHIHAAVDAAYRDLSNDRNPEVVVLAELVAMDFREALADHGLPLDVACRYYDVLYGLYHWAAQRFTDMARFDTKAVMPFAEWLGRNYPPAPPARPLPKPGQVIRVGYLCTYAHLERGNAITPLLRSIVLEHVRRPGREIFMYCVGWSSPDFVEGFDGTGVTVRDLPQGHTYHGLDGIVNAIRADQIDVLITDTGAAVPTYVFSRRAAPVQIWLEMGYPFWTIGELDWVLLAGREHQPHYGIPADRWSPTIDRCASELLVRPITDAQLANARRVVTPGGFVMACFTRLIKATSQYTRLVRRLLRAIPGSRFLLVGGGASHEVDLLATDPEFRGRVVLIRELVDLNVYSRVVDVFLDTFPFAGGGAVREVTTCGVPVVAMRGGDYDGMVIEQRDPSLCAWTVDEYCALVVRLAVDIGFRTECRKAALELGKRFTRVEDMIGPIEGGIAKAIASVNARAEQNSRIGRE